MRASIKRSWWVFPFAVLVASVLFADYSRVLGMGDSVPGIGGKYEAKFTEDGALIRPEGVREWVYVGATATPNALNGGEAPFPEFHNVYIDPKSWKHWVETGEFRDGTMLAKELTLMITEDAYEDGSVDEPSGRGYFMTEFSGFEIALKDSERYADEPGYWAYFSFGHVSPDQYADSVKAFPTGACNVCHDQFADDDFVFTQFYPVLTAAKP